MRKHLLLFTILFLFAFAANAQGWIKHFPATETVYGGEINVCADGNYLVSLTALDDFGSLPGGSYVAKINLDGELLWLEKYSDIATNAGFVTETPDGGYVVTQFRENAITELTEIHLVKLDANLQETGAVLINDLGSAFTKIVFTSNNEIVIGGGIFTGLIKKFDQNLNLTSEINVPNTVQDIIVVENDELVVTYNESKVARYDNAGNQVWLTDLYPTLQSNFMNVHSMDDGSFMLFSSSSSNIVARQINISSQGEVLWITDLLQDNLYFVPLRQVKVSDGFISTGTIDSEFQPEGNNVLLLKSDFDGNVIWQRDIHVLGDLWEFCKDIVPTPDGGVIGTVDVLGEATNYRDQVYVFRANAFGNIFDQTLSGTIGYDQIGNCDIEDSSALQNWTVSVANDNSTHYAVTDSLGNYTLEVPTGIFTVTVHPPNNLWEVCENEITIGFVENAQLTRDFPVKAALDCPAMAVQTSMPIARPCFDNNTYYINYCNEGTITAASPTIEIFIDTLFEFVSATIPFNSQGSAGDEIDSFLFELDDLEPGECGSFSINFLLNCNAEINETYCFEANAFPSANCNFNPDWNGAFVEASVTCESDSITFTMENTGIEDMSLERNFIVVEDAIILFQEPYNLTTAEIRTEKFPANGSTFRLEAMQEVFAPGDPYVKVWVEGCGINPNGEISTGFVNQFSLGDNIPHTDIDCVRASSAYDPNDKQGFPLGYGDEHFIRENTDIEYLIRFQNTGNDTAFTVVLLDTIASELDLSTIRVGPASHDYEWSIVDGNVLQFTFNSILLPDSTTNLDASNGFVEFIISQQPDLPIGTVIKNEVGIYFDYNEVVMTNETFHTIGMDFIEIATQSPTYENARIQVFPNPFNAFTVFKMGNISVENGNFELFDLGGRPIFQQQFNGNEFIFHRTKNISAGNYFYQITDPENGILNSGQLSIQ